MMVIRSHFIRRMHLTGRCAADTTYLWLIYIWNCEQIKTKRCETQKKHKTAHLHFAAIECLLLHGNYVDDWQIDLLRWVTRWVYSPQLSVCLSVCRGLIFLSEAPPECNWCVFQLIFRDFNRGSCNYDVLCFSSTAWPNDWLTDWLLRNCLPASLHVVLVGWM